MKLRTQGEKLTADDIARLRAAYDAGCHPEDAASDVNCTRRNVSKYFRMFRGYSLPRGRGDNFKRRRPIPVPGAEQRPKPSRFYTSTFEL